MKNASWKSILRTALLAVTVGALPALAGPDNVGLGTGRDGPLSVTTGANTVINVYAQVTAPLAPGDTAILFANVAPVGGVIAAGDLVMVLQTTGIVPEPPSGGPTPIDLTNNPVGRWEFARVTSVVGNTLNLTAPLIHPYAGNVTQIIRVPEYTTANIGFGRSISPVAWDRATNTGGVVAFLATGAFSNSGSVDARFRGFRGGQPVDDTSATTGCTSVDEPAPQGGQKGEGIASTLYGVTVTGRGRVGNGGGGGVCFKSGGGGGGNGGVGGLGGNTDLADGNRAVGGEGGAALTYSLLNHLTLGGGGGAGHSTEVAGGPGGGIIFIRVSSLTLAGNFFASGNTSGSATDAASGGGAGGTIYLRISGAATCGTIQAAGGSGGSTGSASIGPGGGGGGGHVLFQKGSGSCTLTGTSVLGANPGTQLDPGSGSYGATAGANGVTITPAGGFPVLPAPVVNTPVNGSRSNNATPTYSGTISTTPALPAGTDIAIFVDGAEVGRTTANALGNWSFTPAAPLGTGTHTVNAVAINTAQAVQSVNSNTNTFIVDVTPPTVSVSAPAEGSRTNNTRPIYSGTVSDNGPGPITVVVRVDGTVLGNATVVGNTWTFTPIVPLAQGTHTVLATATDDLGNTASDSNDFTVDLTAPSVSVTAPAEGSRTNDTTPTYSGTVSDNGPGPFTVVITVDGTVVGNATVVGNTWTLTPTVPLGEGIHTITATATDDVGNTANDSNDFTVDITAPTVAVTAPAEGSSTNDTTPDYSGTVEAGATVSITVDGVVLGNATVVGATWTFTPTVPLAEGPHTVMATAMDEAGNTANDSNNFTVDLTAPTVAVTTPAESSRTNDTTPTYSGTVEAGATVVITVDGVVLGNATVVGATWTFTPTVPLLEGPHTVLATATDEAGNTASDSNDFSVDLTAPTVAVTTPAEGSSTNDSTPTYSGTVEAGATVVITVDGTVVGNATVVGATWTFTPTVPLAEGPHTVTATATDEAGNTASDSNNFTVDTIAPAVSVTTPAEGSSTNDTTPTYSGTVEAGATVVITVDGVVLGNATVVGATWTFTPTVPLLEGPHTVMATAMDEAGNTANDSNNFTVDLTAPTVAVTTPAEGSSTNDTTPTYSGTVEAGATVSITVDGVMLGNAMVTGTTWTFTPTVPLLEGPHTVTATATDEAGNTASDSNNFTVDLTAPTVSVTTPAEGSRINDSTPTYSGTVEAGATVVITVDGTVLGNATVTGTTWTFTPTVPLAEGPHTVTATATDAAGNTASDSNNFTVDTIAPAVAVTTPAEGSSTNDTTPTYNGTVEAGATLVITVDGVVLGNATVVGATWTFTPTVPLAEGPHTVTATATDAAGNTASDSNDFTVDTTAPTVAVTTPAEGSRTNDSTPDYSGTVEAGATVVITVDGVVLGNATVTGTTWTFTPTVPLPDGPHTVMATATDVAGNTASDSNDFTVDTTAPAAPMVTTPANGAIIADNTPTYSGTAESGSTVTVIVDGTAVGTTTADASGNWSFTPVTGLTNGQHTVTATAMDAAGNVSPQGNTNTFTVDANIPMVPVITGPANNTVTSDNTPPISGTAPPNSTVTVFVDGSPVGTTTSDGAGNWTFTPTTPLADGPHDLTATTTNAAGNTSPESNTVRITIDTGVPDTTIVSGPSGNTESTSATFDFSSSETGVTYECNLDGAGFQPCTDPATFNGLAVGQHTLQVRARDSAGNVDPTPATATWTVVRPTTETGDRDFLGDGVGCAASGGDPSSLAMMGLGLLAVLLARRRRQ